jgi:O-6-methylguanine DNA methyltransferase
MSVSTTPSTVLPDATPSARPPWDVEVDLISHSGERRDPIELRVEQARFALPPVPAPFASRDAAAHVWDVHVATTSIDGREALVGIVRDLDELFEAWPAATILPPGTVRQHGSQPVTDLAVALARLGTPLPVLVAGSALKLAVLRALVEVPLGATITYAELARAAGAPRAVRAAARVMSTNVVPLVLPCHRVVPTGGGTGRYGWGDEVKRQLLALERTAMEVTP